MHSPLPRRGDELKSQIGVYPRNKYLGATSEEEQIYIEWLSQHTNYTNACAVDLGSWMGSLTCSIGRGATRNTSIDQKSKNKKLIHAYDLFTWHDGFNPWVEGTSFANRYKQGDNFVQAFEEHCSEFTDLIETHAEELSTPNWDNTKIALLCNDAWKLPTIALGIIKAFFPHCIPGKTILIHQDYLWCTESFIHILMFRFRDYFKPVYQVPNGTTVSFICKKEINLNYVPLLYDYQIEKEEIYEAFEWSASFLDETAKACLALGKAWLLSQAGYENEAKIEAKKALSADQSNGFIKWQIEGFGYAGYSHLFQ